MDRPVLHHRDPVALLQHPVHDPHQHDHAQIGVIPAVHQHGGQRGIAVPFGRGQALDDGLQRLMDADAGLGADPDRVRGVDADHILDLRGHAVTIGRGQVDLVQHRHDLMIRVQRVIDIGQRLRLDPLGTVHHQKRTFHGAHRPAHLIGKVDVTGRVDQVQHIGLPVIGLIVDAHGVGLDRDPALTFDIHAVEQLFLHVPVLHGAGGLDQPVGQGGFPVVDMGNDGEIADARKLCHAGGYDRERGFGQGGLKGYAS